MATQIVIGHAVNAIATTTGHNGMTLHSTDAEDRTTTSTPVDSANHFNCCRWTPVERRNRTAIPTNAATSDAATRTNPIQNSTSVDGPSIAYGLVPETYSVPLRGLNTQPGSASSTPTTLSQKINHHLRSSSRSVGNSSTINTNAGACGSQLAVAIASAVGPPGQPSVAARRPQPCARSAVSAF